jgi:hypothetical protein
MKLMLCSIIGFVVLISSSNGLFDYTVTGTNNDSIDKNLEAWVMVRLPDQSQYGPVVGPLERTLPGEISVNRDRSQYVPAFSPPGTYKYSAYVGFYPDMVWDSDSFSVEKLLSIK